MSDTSTASQPSNTAQAPLTNNVPTQQREYTYEELQAMVDEIEAGLVTI